MSVGSEPQAYYQNSQRESHDNIDIPRHQNGTIESATLTLVA